MRDPNNGEDGEDGEDGGDGERNYFLLLIV
jgi:hypothetical protein